MAVYATEEGTGLIVLSFAATYLTTSGGNGETFTYFAFESP